MSLPRLLFTRPEDEQPRARNAARQAGFELLAEPLLTINELPFALPAAEFDAVLFTSPRAPAIVASQAPALQSLPCCAVGPRTAESAVAAGFDVVLTGETDGIEIVHAAFDHGFRQLLQPGGVDRIAIPTPDGMTLVPVPVYQAVAADRLSAAAIDALRAGDLFATLLFSPRSARIFTDLLAIAGIDRQRLRLVALSENVATAAGEGWKAMEIAHLPTLEAALEAAMALWQKPADD